MILGMLSRAGIALLCLLVTALLIFWLGGPLPAGTDGLTGVFSWLGRGLVGDFGQSVSRSGPVGPLLLQSLAVTLPLLLGAALLAAAIAVGFSLLALRLMGRRTARALTILVEIVATLPAFWVGLLLLLVFAVGLKWLPAGGFFAWNENPGGAAVSLLLPMLALALPFGARLAQPATRALLSVRQSLPVDSAIRDGKTLSTALGPHGLRAVLLETLVAARTLPVQLLAATWIVETAFYLPGLGRLIVDGLTAADPLLARGALLIAALLCGLLVLAVEIGRDALDPRPPAGRAS